jgi:hypothetical protein
MPTYHGDGVSIHLTPTKFTPQEHEKGCSKPPPESSYGLAGGGMGSYTFCPECGAVLDKVLDHQYDEKE